MNYSPKVLFPGIVAGIFAIVFLTGMIYSPALAETPAPVANTAFHEAAALPPGDQSGAAEQAGSTVQQGVEAETQGIDLSQEAGGGVQASEIDCSLPTSYPESIRQWCAWIEQYSGEHGIDPRLIAAVMLQESGGKPDAYSKSGAVGLMQVMPRDGLAAGFMCPNGPCFASRPSMDELFDPEFNISYGVRMLAGLIAKHGGARDALKAYGPMNYGYRYADIVLGIYNNYQ